MKLEQLFYLTEAAKYHSISIAAQNNFVPSSTVSTSITKLEKELGVTLFKRSNKGVELTEIGNAIVEKSKYVISLLEDIKLATDPTAYKVSLNITALPSLVDTVLADLVLEVEKRGYPLGIEINSNDPIGVLQEVQLGLADIGILFDNKKPDLKSSHYPNLTYYPMFMDEYCLFVGRNSPLYNRESVTMEEALNCQHIAYKTEFTDDNNVLTKLIKAYGTPQIALRVDNTESMRRMIAKSDFVAFFPRFTILYDAYIESKMIKCIPVEDADLKIYISFVESKLFKDRQGNTIFKSVIKKVLDTYYSSLTEFSL